MATGAIGRTILAVALVLGLPACTWAQAAGTKVLVDFEGIAADALRPEGLQAQLVDAIDGRALKIRSGTATSWPGVAIPAPDGAWDLTGYDHLVADIENLGDEPVRVLLQASDPQANGETHCSVGAGTVAAGKRGTVRIELGRWHGQAKPFDAARTVSLRVFLDRPKADHHFRVDNLRAERYESPIETLMQTDCFRNLENPLGRGINMGNMLEAPREGEWGVRLDESYFELIKDAGFDNVRIPVRWSSRTAAEPPYAIDPEFMARVERAVDAALGQGLKVVLNIHHFEEIMKEPAAQRERFLAMWRQIAAHFADAPPQLWFELLNEPTNKLDAAVWNDYLKQAIDVIRESNPDRTLVVGPANWNSLAALEQLELPEDDRNLVATFHFYDPFQFTHQGASWTGEQAQQWLGTPWTGTDAEKRALVEKLDRALTWSIANERPLYMGEFGAYSKADMDSRVRWTRFVAQEALKRKFGFAYWEFSAGFGAYDPQANAWREGLLGALVE